MNSKQRAYLRGRAGCTDAVFNIGKASLTDEVIEAVAEVLEARELVKIGVLKNCIDDPKQIAFALAESTRSEVVEVKGKKIVLYKQADEPNKRKLSLPE